MLITDGQQNTLHFESAMSSILSRLSEVHVSNR